MYGYKSVKWLGRITLAAERVRGFWESNGYQPDAWLALALRVARQPAGREPADLARRELRALGEHQPVEARQRQLVGSAPAVGVDLPTRAEAPADERAADDEVELRSVRRGADEQ